MTNPEQKPQEQATTPSQVEGLRKLMVAEQMMLTQDMADLLAINRQSIRNNLGQSSKPEGDEVPQFVLGDVNNTITHPPSPQEPAKTAWGLGKTLLTAGLLASGVGAPVGVGLALSSLPGILKALPQLAPQQQPVPPVVQNHDTVEQLGIDMIVEPPK